VFLPRPSERVERKRHTHTEREREREREKGDGAVIINVERRNIDVTPPAERRGAIRGEGSPFAALA